jgi:ATP-binding cassette subfamily F protein 3
MDAGTVTTEGEQVTYVSSEVVNAGPDAFVQILHARPTFLLLDVNGTTPEALKKITGLIAGFRGGMLIASEDTGVMQVAKVTRVIEIQDATKAITSYTGSFAEYLVEREKNRIRVSEAYEKQQKEKRRIEDWLTKKQIEASNDRSPQKGATIRTKKKYLQREILDKEIPNPGLIIPSETVD